MKLVIAYIQEDRLDHVLDVLTKAELHRVSVTNALGCGAQLGYSESYRGARKRVNLLKKIRLEIAINDDFEERTIDAIKEGCQTGKIGDGKIFVLELPRCVRIRTGEEGPEAIG
ncbi:MAG: P-II family nitrogen regulator [Myxococcota bacterium]